MTAEPPKNGSPKHSLGDNESVRSLRSELAVAANLKELGWQVSHSAYFTDPIENKPRETDIVARRAWVCNCLGTRIESQFALLVERKHLEQKELFLAKGEAPVVAGFDSQVTYPGRMDTIHGKRMWLREAVMRGGVSSVEADALEVAFGEEVSKSVQSRLGRALPMPCAPPAAAYAVAFREGYQNKRDPCSGPIWGACMSLRSAAIADHRIIVTNWQYGLELVMCLSSAPARLGQLKMMARDMLASVSYRHPVVVVDSKLVLVDLANVEEVPSCRLRLNGLAGDRDWVCDIVNSSHSEAYFRALTGYIEAHLSADPSA